MQFTPNGPDVPERLVIEHEEGNVIFFCGAGISIPAGLPSFGDLVKRLHKELHIDLDDEELEKKTCDQLLDELEHTSVKKFRPKLLSLLKTKRNPNLNTHLALLKLATQNKNDFIRLVTTNYDRLFEKAYDKLKINHKYFSAPTLPIPKKTKWDGIVYLHGLLPKKENATDLNNLVITSGDFGLAYLTERWAARFVSELFRNFSVCFIGYSLNDPVMRYMTDAISADRMLGEKLPTIWAFVPYKDLLNKQEEAQRWKNKGIEPILYSNENHHSILHETIQTWANIYCDGVNGKEMLIAKFANTNPAANTQEDDYVSRVLWALADPSCRPAQRFATLDPKPSLDWLLGPFSQQIKSKENNITEAKFSSKMLVTQYLSPFVITEDTLPSYHPIYPIVQWSLNYVNDERLLFWILEQGPTLRTYYKSQILKRLDQLSRCNKIDKENEVPSEQLINLWKLFTVDALSFRNNFTCDFYSWIEQFESNDHKVTYDLRLELRKVLAPKLFVSNSLFSKGIYTELGLASDYVKDSVHGFNWFGSLHCFIQDFQQLLRDAVALSKSAGNDTLFDLPSIEPNTQNNISPDYTVLIELLRDSWLELLKKEPMQAKLIALEWLFDEDLLFNRLGLFAASVESSISSEDWIESLLKNDAQNLWDIRLRREVLRLFVNQGSITTKTQIKRLEKALLKGPSIQKYSKESLEHIKWLYISKFQSSGVELSKQSKAFLKKIKKNYPSWVLATDQSDEFPIWYSEITAIDTKTPISATPNTEKEIQKWLLDQYLTIENFEEFDQEPRLLNQWSEICTKHLIKAARATLKTLPNLKNERGITIWRRLLEVASNKTRVKRSWKLFSGDVVKLDDEILERLSNEFSWWMYEASKQIKCYPDNFFEISKKLLSMPLVGTLGDVANPVTKAMNHPFGRITLSMLNLLLSDQPHDGQGLNNKFKNYFNLLCTLDKQQYLPARILLGANLVPLYRIDPLWAEKKLLPLFNWQMKESLDMWFGFLWSPRLYLPLIEKLKPDILKAKEHYSEMGAQIEKFAAFTTYIALEKVSIFSDKEFRQLFSKLPLDGLKRVAIVLRQRLESAGDKKTNYWRNRIRPFIEKIWPSRIDKSSSRLTYFLIKLAIESGENFPEAIQVISCHLTHLDDSGFIFKELIDAKCCKNYPQATLVLLDKVHPIKRIDCLCNFYLKNCVLAIGESNTKIKEEKIYKRLADLIGI